MKVLKKISMVCLAVALSVVALSGCGGNNGSSDKSEEKSLATIQDAGVLKVGLCPEYPPFESVDSSGKIEGFDADLAEAIGKELGVKVEFANTPWEGLISGLQNKDFDIIISAMSPEEATSATKEVNLSNAYYRLNDVIAVRKDDNSISSKKDLEGKTVGYQTGSAAEQSVAKIEEEGIKLKAKNPYNRNADAFSELKNGRIDAVVVSYPYAVTQSKEDKSFKVVNDPVSGADLVAISVKGSDSLTKAYNDALKKIKDSGKYEEIEKKWLSIQ